MENVRTRSILLILLTTALAVAEQYGGITFERPANWTEQHTHDGLQFRAPVPNSPHSILLTMLPALPARGDFRAHFEAAVQTRLHLGEHVVQQGASNFMNFAKDRKSLAKGVVVEDASGRRVYRLYVGFDLTDRIEWMEGEAVRQEDWSSFTAPLTAFAGTFRFRGAPAAASPVAPAAPPVTAGRPIPGGLSGWYTGGADSASFNPNSGKWSTGAKYSYYRFFPDGRVYWGWTLPEGMTMDAFDRAPDPAKVGNSGTYTIRDGRIHMIWAKTARSPEHWPFTQSNGLITMAGTEYYRIAPCDNLHMSGSWTSKALSTRTITFTPQGTFQQHGVSPGGERGSYRLHGNTLELTFANGSREEHSFFRFPREENSLIIIDSARFLRQ
jgi:hypothetical protein